MTKKDIDNIISIICPNDEDFEKPIISPAYLKKELEALALEQEPCDDAISRQAVLEQIDQWAIGNREYLPTNAMHYLTRRIQDMPPVTPQPKTGHWIDIMVGDMPAQACDRCNTFYPLAYTGGGHKYCPNCGCGAKMQEVEE